MNGNSGDRSDRCDRVVGQRRAAGQSDVLPARRASRGLRAFRPRPGHPAGPRQLVARQGRAGPAGKPHVSDGRHLFVHFAGHPWIAKEWLGQILLALAYMAGGWNGVALLTIATIALTAFLLAWHLSDAA